jgi:hypothetical protein
MKINSKITTLLLRKFSLFIFIFIIIFNSGVRAGERCPVKLTFQTKSEKKLCLSDYPISQQQVSESEKLIDITRRFDHIAVAVSKDKNCRALTFSTKFQLGHPIAEQLNEDEAMSKCIRIGCNCKILISRGKILDDELFISYEVDSQSVKDHEDKNKSNKVAKNKRQNSEDVDTVSQIEKFDPSKNLSQSEKEQKNDLKKKESIVEINEKKGLAIEVLESQISMDGIVTIKLLTNIAIDSLKINNEEIGGGKEGIRTIKKYVKIGEDSIFEILAIDANGNSATKTITVSRPLADSKPLVAALNPAQVKRQPERDAVAIIIGIADYKNLPRADYANDDARVFYDYAIRALGVKPENIKLLVDADADEVGIYRAFKTWLPSRVRVSTDVYVYYSGHGLPTADGQGLYVLPQRADRDFMDKTAITQAEINAAIQAAKPNSVTIFLDACYSGQARTGETLLASARPVSLKAETTAFPEGFTVITASKGDQISSSSPELKHGIFSYYLMRGMEGDADANRDGRITAGEMRAYLAENVSRQAGMMNRRQEPQLIGDSNKILVGR